MNKKAKPVAGPVLNALQNAPQGDGYTIEDLMLLLGFDVATVDAELKLQHKAGRAVVREGVWYACDTPSRPKPATSKGLVYAPTMHVLDDEIFEAKHQVSEWSKHLRALEAYARTVSR
jgi:hypothetical protein